MTLATSVLASAVIFVLINVGVALQRAFASLRPCPRGGFYWFHPHGIVCNIFAPMFPPRGWLGHYNGRFLLYAKKGTTILSGIWVWYARPMVWVADPEALKVITSDRHTFPKDEDVYAMIDIYGKSLLSTDGNEWRRHVAVAGPAFSDSTSALAWAETLRLMNEWFADELDKGLCCVVNPDPEQTVTVDMLSKMTQLTLHVIAAAGFGVRETWTTFSHTHTRSYSTDETLPFHVALESSLIYLPTWVLAPRFLYSLPFRIPRLSDNLSAAQQAFGSMKEHMAGLVNSVKEEGTANNGTSDDNHAEDHEFAQKRANLLRRLVQANEVKGESGERQKGTLTDDELFSNIFTFLAAGHETTAHTLAFAILFLTLYPDVQAKLREESHRVWSSDDDAKHSTYDKDFDKFEYTLAVFRETLRCFPTAPRLEKVPTKDTVLTGKRFHHGSLRGPKDSYDGANTNVQIERNESIPEEKLMVSIPKGSLVVLDIWAVHMNPLVWGPDAHEFRPERFIDTQDYKWPREGFLGFSSGLRGCIGQRFALAEAVCALANLVRRYEILPAMDSRRFASHEEFKRAMMGYSVGHTISPSTKSVKLKRIDKLDQGAIRTKIY